MIQKSISLHHKNITKQFIISNKTRINTLKNLIKKAFHFQYEIKYLKNNEHHKIRLEDLIDKYPSGQYQISLDDYSSQQKSKSQVCSQKNMSRHSGRKNPPSEHQLLDSKFYIDDFQFFMSEVSSKKTNKLFGIVFFNNKKKAIFLGKKILRELIFEFEKIQFFYALHPIKMHNSSALLGQVLIFSLFRGKKMIHERQFPEQITAADQIPNYLKNLIKIGDIKFEESAVQNKKPKNLIHVNQQRSFDHKIQNSPQKLSDFGSKPNRTAKVIKVKPITPDKQAKGKNIFNNQTNESPIKSQITNQISFENDFYQPDWFYEGESLTRIQKCLISALIKSNDQTFISFVNGLNLKFHQKEKFNIKLIKVFLKGFFDQKFHNLSDQKKQFIQNNQQNRKSFVFNTLLKLFKFGDLTDFIDTVNKNISSLQQPKQLDLKMTQSLESNGSRKKQAKNIQYSSIAKQTDKIKGGFTIKLLDCQKSEQIVENNNTEISSPFRQNRKIHQEHTQLAHFFHDKILEKAYNQKDLNTMFFDKDYSQIQKKAIIELICKNDAFMIETFIKNPQKTKKMDKVPSKIIKNYIKQVENKYQNIRMRVINNPQLKCKLQKLQIFNGLLYYLYKQRIINKKQLKISFYLYTWSDLNIISAFQVYLLDLNLEQFIDTIYSIDYNYYLNDIYEIDHSQVEQFTDQIESQLMILFLYEKYIYSGNDRLSLQKFIRAGDTSLLVLYLNQSIQELVLIHKIIQLSKHKKEELNNISNRQKINSYTLKEQKIERCNFINEIIATRCKGFNQNEKVHYLITNQEPMITSIFQLLDSYNDQNEFNQSFRIYAQNIDSIHMKFIIGKFAKQASLDLKMIEDCRTDIIKGVYQTFLLTNDTEDAIDTLQRIVKKNQNKIK